MQRHIAGCFPSWRECTSQGNSKHWSANYDAERHLELLWLLELLEDEFVELWADGPSATTRVCSALLSDIVDYETENEGELNCLQFIRFFASTKCANHALTYGSPGHVFDWLRCSLGDGRFVSSEPGKPCELHCEIGRLRFFFGINEVAVLAFETACQWMHALYYYSWKWGGHRDFAEEVLIHAKLLLQANNPILDGDSDIAQEWARATSQVATWLHQADHSEAQTWAEDIERCYLERANLSREARKVLASCLASQVGTRTSSTPSQWCELVMSDFDDLLGQHERVTFVVGNESSSDEMVEGEIKQFVDAIRNNQSKATFLVRQVQLFENIAPAIVRFLQSGKVSTAVRLTGLWFGVSNDDVRRTDCVAVVPNLRDGALVSSESRPLLIRRDSRGVLRQVVEVFNPAFDTNIIVRDDHANESYERTGRRVATKPGELEAAFVSYSKVDEIPDELIEPNCGLFIPSSFPAPWQALASRHSKVARPIVTSYEEPNADRSMKRALIWSFGTLLGEAEAQTVATLFENAGMEVELHCETAIQQDEFVEFYEDDRYDIVWIIAHGDFDCQSPLESNIKVGEGETVFLDSLLSSRLPRCGRRLLFLNICLSGAAFVGEAPARLGLGALLASKDQAVIGHLWEVGTFYAPAFGVLSAIGIINHRSFLDGFRFALQHIPCSRDEMVATLSRHLSTDSEMINRVSNSPFDIDVDNIATWGSPVFYE